MFRVRASAELAALRIVPQILFLQQKFSVICVEKKGMRLHMQFSVYLLKNHSPSFQDLATKIWPVWPVFVVR